MKPQWESESEPFNMYDVIHEVYNSTLKRKEFNRKYKFTEYLDYVHFFRSTAHQKEDMIKMCEILRKIIVSLVIFANLC